MPVNNAGALPPVNGKTPAKPAVKKTATRDARQDALTGLGQLTQIPLVALHQYADAGAVGIYWPNIAKEIADLAETQPVIRNLVDPLIRVGPYTALVTAVLPFVLQVGVNHGRVPAGVMGTVPANSLSAQVEAGLVANELAAMQAQLDAEKQAQALREEISASRKQMEDSVSD